MLVYIAGPMTGIRQWNFPEFDEARDELIKLGHVVISPADMDRAAGFDPANLPDDWNWSMTPSSFNVDAAIDRDIAAVRRCDAVYMLGGWESSLGAFAERALAKWCRKPIYCKYDFPPSNILRS